MAVNTVSVRTAYLNDLRSLVEHTFYNDGVEFSQAYYEVERLAFDYDVDVQYAWSEFQAIWGEYDD